MTQEKTRNDFVIVIIVLCTISAASLTAIAFSIQITNLNNQINDLQAPKLVNISVGYSDNGQGTVLVTGYVYNVGNITASGCHVIVNLSRNGATLNSTYFYFGKDSSSGPFLGGDYVSGETSAYVDGNVTYTGSPPTNVTLTLGWLAPWQIIIP
jgi:hypothetical protein